MCVPFRDRRPGLTRSSPAAEELASTELAGACAWMVRVTSVDPVMAAATAFFAGVAAAHRSEDVEAYLAFFAPECVWVTSRGVCYRGRDSLGDYLRGAIPGGLADGSVSYRVESVHPLADAIALVVVDQLYTDAAGRTRDDRARHTHTYTVTLDDAHPLILAGQNTVNIANPAQSAGCG